MQLGEPICSIASFFGHYECRRIKEFSSPDGAGAGDVMEMRNNRNSDQTASDGRAAAFDEQPIAGNAVVSSFSFSASAWLFAKMPR